MNTTSYFYENIASTTISTARNIALPQPYSIWYIICTVCHSVHFFIAIIKTKHTYYLTMARVIHVRLKVSK